MRKKKLDLQKLVFEKEVGTNLSEAQSKDVKGAGVAFTDGCTDGCTPLATQWNCTYGGCTNNCSGNWGCFTSDNCP
ncbi:class I lanthipeptide [Sphingobacterium sp.]|jgi:hypothetical protein|uniref:class I lanthipeptide n=1 Tax=Sphingobacterium sp. TaxID=341027 RepID=UPI00289E0B34|nr:class I lanthipeptide [Sphingobacterium sp.]